MVKCVQVHAETRSSALALLLQKKIQHPYQKTHKPRSRESEPSASVSTCMCTCLVTYTQRDLHPLEVEFQAIVSHHGWLLGSKPQSLAQTISALSTEPFLLASEFLFTDGAVSIQRKQKTWNIPLPNMCEALSPILRTGRKKNGLREMTKRMYCSCRRSNTHIKRLTTQVQGI